MAQIWMRPTFRTSGGEVCDVMVKDRFAGTLTLVYREGDQVSGALQLDKDAVTAKQKEKAVKAARRYVESLVQALQAAECEVVVSYARFQQVITYPETMLDAAEEDEPDEGVRVDNDSDFDVEYIYDDCELEDEREYAGDRSASEDEQYEEYYELVAVDESAGRMTYHVYDGDRELAAEARVKIDGADVYGEVHWRFTPMDEELHAVADLIVSDFDDEEIDLIELNMLVDGDLIEKLELVHDDLLPDVWPESGYSELESELDSRMPDQDDYAVVLVREDGGDMLTYEILKRSYGNLPIGTATIDIGERQIVGFVDFRAPSEREDREWIAELLMEEIDNEREIESFNLTMLHDNKPIDEIRLMPEQLH